MTPNNGPELEQGMAYVADTIPMYWWRMFTNLKDAGFTEAQAMQLLCTYINTAMRPSPTREN